MGEQLRDIREMFPDDEIAQHCLLQNTFPVQFHAQTAKNMPDEEGIKSTHGLDPGCLGPDETEGEDERRFIRWTWSDLSGHAGKHYPSHAIRYSILKTYYPHGLLRGRGLSFLALAEHDVTYNLFWRRHPFLLFAPFQARRDTDASDWHIAPLHHPDDLRVLARDGLVHWDGQASLPALISSKFGLANYGQAQYLWTSNIPAVIRVLLKLEDTMPTTFQGIRDILVDCPNLQPVRGRPDRPESECDYSLPSEGEHMVPYRLVAMVLCRHGSEAVQLYSLEGEPLPLEEFQEESEAFAIGIPGKTYMLFYARVLPRSNRGRTYKETVREPNDVERNMAGIYQALSITAPSQPPPIRLPYDRPKRDREPPSASSSRDPAPPPKVARAS
ncbi:hypothetical protein SLS62_011041 [Diatrype stigma]|uniref:Uncharacterized protein n=1 Tax=Diatrype stigma TaxID=117547 RepID=A0AAN9UD37_9PEZI